MEIKNQVAFLQAKVAQALREGYTEDARDAARRIQGLRKERERWRMAQAGKEARRGRA